jgi:hypothetical protein
MGKAGGVLTGLTRFTGLGMQWNCADNCVPKWSLGTRGNELLKNDSRLVSSNMAINRGYLLFETNVDSKKRRIRECRKAGKKIWASGPNDFYFADFE